MTYTLCHYQHADVYVVDLKKIEFVHYKDHVTLATTLNDAFAVISSIRQEMFNRMELLKNAKVNHILKYKKRLSFIVLIIDEFAQLWPQNKRYTVFELRKIVIAIYMIFFLLHGQ